MPSKDNSLVAQKLLAAINDFGIGNDQIDQKLQHADEWISDYGIPDGLREVWPLLSNESRLVALLFKEWGDGERLASWPD